MLLAHFMLLLVLQYIPITAEKQEPTAVGGRKINSTVIVDCSTLVLEGKESHISHKIQCYLQNNPWTSLPILIVPSAKYIGNLWGCLLTRVGCREPSFCGNTLSFILNRTSGQKIQLSSTIYLIRCWSVAGPLNWLRNFYQVLTKQV